MTFAKGLRLVFVCNVLLLFTVMEVTDPTGHGRAERDASESSPLAAVRSSRVFPNASHFVELYGNFPLSFEANEHEGRPAVRFSARGRGYQILLTNDGPSFIFRGDHVKYQRAVTIKFFGGRAHRVRGIEKQPGITNYFLGRDRSKWKSGIANYAKVRYEQVYPGVDIVYYGHGRDLEYDLILQPGAHQSNLKFSVSGLARRSVALDESGGLTLWAHGAELRFHRPVAYQQRPGAMQQKVAAHYSLSSVKSVGEEQQLEATIEVGNYDHSLPLVIDPIATFSTFLGGTSLDTGNAIAVDGAGNSYVAGWTYSTDFPTMNSFQGSKQQAASNAFITKINAAGTAILYSTYLGGTANANGNLTNGGSANGVAVDANGNAYIVGNTDSSNFPVTPGALNANCTTCPNLFVTKLDSTGSQLVYSTYFGGTPSSGSLGDNGLAIAVDMSGSAYVAGRASSQNFPTTLGAFQITGGGAFVSKLNPTGSALSYSTFIGPGLATGVAVNVAGNAFVTGGASSAAFPTTPGVFQTAYRTSGGNSTTGFVSELNGNGSALMYSTFLGGSDLDLPGGIAIDGAGNAYVAGQTFSTDFPVTNAFQPTLKGPANAFVSKLNSNGSALVYSTYLGGSTDEVATGISVDSSGNAYVTGLASSTDFPLLSPLQSVYGGGTSDAFLTVIDPNGSPSFSTFLGGKYTEQGNGIAVDSAGDAYIAGTTDSPNFPAINALQPSLSTSPTLTCSPDPFCADAFVAKFAISKATPTPDFALASSTPPQSINAGQTATYQITVSPVGGFAQSIALSCSGEPLFSSCSLPGAWSSTGLNALTATVNVATTARSSASHIVSPPNRHRWSEGAFAAFAFGTIAMGIFQACTLRAAIITRWIAGAVPLLFLFSLSSCGSGGGGASTSAGTPPGTYSILITGKSGSVSHSVTLTLMVN